MKGLSKLTECGKCVYMCMKGVFTNNDLLLIDGNKREINYSEGDIILKQGSYVSQVLYLKKGQVKIVLEGKNDKNTILQIVNEKNFIALPVLGDLEVYPFSVIALTHCEICNIRKETLVEISERNVEFLKFLISRFKRDFIFLYSRISVLSTRNNHGKLASALLNLCNSYEPHEIHFLSRKELAEFASISIESTNKILQELKHDKIIEIHDKSITILQYKLIEKLSSVG